jgi:hypothetical protein
VLPVYRQIFMRVMVTAAADQSAAVARSLRDALAPYGRADIQEDGPYYKVPTDLEFSVSLEPHGRVDDCINAFRADVPHGWSESPVGPAWRAEPGKPHFLHPALQWLTASPEEADTLPRFESGDIAVIRDTPAARRHDVVGREARISGRSAPVPEDPVWGYFVFPDGWQKVLYLGEPDLEPTGRRAPPATAEEWVRIGVSTEGEITDSSSKTWRDVRDLLRARRRRRWF